jgi:nicotinate-nucleotide adenylyltransferase
MNIALFFGSFNPIHHGHLVIAQAALTHGFAEEVWFVISPQNPFKKEGDLLAEHDRLMMVEESIQSQPLFKTCTIEFGLPKPNYTVTTVHRLCEQYPEMTFKLLLGEDNLVHFHLWNDYEDILRQAQLLVYPRPNTAECALKSHPKVTFLSVPLFDISATYIRSLIQEQKAIKFLVNEKVEKMIADNGWYQTMDS